MVQYNLAVATIVTAIICSADGSFISTQGNERLTSSVMPTKEFTRWSQSNISKPMRASNNIRRERVAVSVSASFNNERDEIENAKNAVHNTFLKLGSVDEEEVDEYEAAMEIRKKALADSQSRGGGKAVVVTYEITLPIVEGTKLQPVEGVTSLAPADDLISQRMGLSLREATVGAVLSEYSLDLDSLQYQTLMDEKIRDSRRSTPTVGAGSVQLLTDSKKEVLDKNFNGLVVSSVVRGGLAWNAGVRVGDKLMASSATMGKKLWPKSTMEGVRSAVSSRRIMASKIKFELQRSGSNSATSKVTEEFELQIARPMGINVEDTEEGFVRVTGLTDQALDSTRQSIQNGDRIVAVNSSIGKQMWPVSSVEGLVSACTTRLPGQPVTLKIERLVDAGENMRNNVASLTNPVTDSTKSGGATTRFRVPSAIQSTGNETHNVLLSRCRDILKRYIAVYKPSAEKERITALPSLVADRILDVIADASAPLDAKTLTLIMNSYLISGKSDEAINVFKAATGLSANGTGEKSDVIIKSKKNEGSRLMVNADTLDLFSATALLRAHAMKKDCFTARNILMAMQGEVIPTTNGNDSLWSGSSTFDLKPDIRCYNIVLAAAARAGGQRNLNMALELFENLSDSSNVSALPRKNVVTYNTMISAYANAGRRQDAFTIFNSMRQVEMMPDKYTTTSLINACINEGDLETAKTLLKNMRRAGIEVDLYAYNTMIKALCDNLQWYEAKELVTEMEFRDVKPDGMTYGLLMNGLLKAKRPGPCLTLFEAACADQSTVALTENVRLYTTAVTAAATLGDHERALELVSRMKYSGLKPNIKTLTALMGACISAKKSELALEVFDKIPTPDGYSISLVFRAYCDTGDYDSAKDTLVREGDGSGKQLSGKQIMSSYKYILQSSLENGRYDVAEEAMGLLLGAGFIPSKKIYRAMQDGLDLLPKKGGRKDKETTNVEDDEKKFDFLLSVLDMLDARKLQFDCNLYAALLFEGSRLGGLRKKIGSFIAERRSETSNVSRKIEVDVGPVDVSNKLEIGWQNLIENYSEYRDRLDDIVLPTIRLRTGERDIRLVLAAEKGVTYKNNRQRSFTGNTNER
eukprot:CAMPEP_0197837556 /NCGR_PEP_ID=MMETSP1437-20131217/32506_1 /TAXON_ID=49252 ORGANISM="Eucampia antarctica, Strain CCMP1452" /NCGR_SAMPLE_ID=MMETSP1437 /ASSEMBLY_ACC=CAM_ASM_001096 /LENGTH=1093 /DNA_ID=CAMNT_0043444695 /DNA_START=154 /DNA_END=3435 /DNA_ORIENTATION=-